MTQLFKRFLWLKKLQILPWNKYQTPEQRVPELSASFATWYFLRLIKLVKICFLGSIFVSLNLTWSAGFCLRNFQRNINYCFKQIFLLHVNCKKLKKHFQLRPKVYFNHSRLLGFVRPLPKIFVMLGPIDLRFGTNANWTSDFHLIPITWQFSCYHDDQGF